MKIDLSDLSELRPAAEVLDPEWSRATLTQVMASTSSGPKDTEQRAPHRRLAIVAGSLAATAAAMLVVPGLGTSAAYSVSEGNAGEIEVEVARLEDSSGLAAALAEKGVDAEVTYLPFGQQCNRYTTEVDRGGLSTSVNSDHSFEITLAPGTIRSGETLVIDASLRDIAPEPTPDSSGISDLGGIEVSQLVEVVQGEPGPCHPSSVISVDPVRP